MNKLFGVLFAIALVLSFSNFWGYALIPLALSLLVLPKTNF